MTAHDTPETPATRLPAGELSVWTALVGYVLSIVGALLPPLVLLAMLGAPKDGQSDTSYLAVPVQYVLLFLFGAVLARVWMRGRYRPEHLGLTVPRTARPWVLGVLGGVAFVVVGQLATRATAQLSEAGSKVAAQLGFGESTLRDVTVILSMAVLAPLGEEMIYRGVIFRGLHDTFARSSSAGMRRAAFVVPILLSSVAFAVSHGGEGQSTQVLFLVLAGVVYGWLYWWTGSLTVAVFAHSVTNAINVVLIAGGGGLTTPALWPLVALTPALAVGAMWGLRAVLGGRGSATAH